MSEAQVAGGFDRLPWLADESPARVRQRNLTGWAAAAVLVVASLAFWLGMRSPSEGPVQPIASRSSATVAVPEARPAPQQDVAIAPPPQLAPLPEVRAAPPREVHIAPPAKKLVTVDVAKQVASDAPVETRPAATAALTPWPARTTTGARGRLVQIGAYGSPLQAKRGWVAMARFYPAVARLSAVVVETRNSHGRTFYRFQIGTTSQAHSEVLCQRMEKIELSCAVVGLPWKAKVER